MSLLKKKTVKLCAIIAAAIILIGAVGYGVYALFFDPYRFADYSAYNEGDPATLDLDTVLTREQALEDMAFMLKRFRERHLAAVNGVPEKILTQYDLEIAQFGETVTVLELYQASSRVLSRMNDGHTRVEAIDVPVMFNATEGAYFSGNPENLLLITTDEEQKGEKVIAIDQVPIETLYQTYLSVTSNEMESYAQNAFVRQLFGEGMLLLLGIDTSDGVDVQVEGKSQPVHLEFAEWTPQDNIGNAIPFVRYEIDTERGLGILYLDSCTINEEYIRTVNAFFTEVRDQGIKHIAIDLRYNGGGSSGVVDEFMRYMPVETYDQGWWYHRYGPLLIKEGSAKRKVDHYSDLVYDGEIYVLTSVNTYSAATTFTSQLKTSELALIVGQQSGNTQEYGELVPFSMPNSHLLVTISNKQYFKGGQAGDTAFTVPDYPCDPNDALNVVYDLISE